MTTKCPSCRNRYVCSREHEFNCINNGYMYFEEDIDTVSICSKCAHRIVCERNAYGDCDNFEEEVNEKEVEINWVYREKRVGRKECPKCGETITLGYTIVDKIPYCSNCGKRMDDRFFNYCPNCGKKIKK